MELVTFNPTLAKVSYETGGPLEFTPPPILREGWTVGVYSVNLNLSDSTGDAGVDFLAPPGVRALAVGFTAGYMSEAESNWHPMTWIDPDIRVYVSRINSSQSFRMFGHDADYSPDPPEGTRDVQLVIDVSKIVVRINGIDTLEVVPDGTTIDADDYVKAVSVTFPAGDHTYSSDPYESTATLFAVSNFVISPLGVPAFWTSFVGTREGL